MRLADGNQLIDSLFATRRERLPPANEMKIIFAKLSSGWSVVGGIRELSKFTSVAPIHFLVLCSLQPNCSDPYKSKKYYKSWIDNI